MARIVLIAIIASFVLSFGSIAAITLARGRAALGAILGVATAYATVLKSRP